jgi:hypothetical protein
MSYSEMQPSFGALMESLSLRRSRTPVNTNPVLKLDTPAKRRPRDGIADPAYLHASLSRELA